MPCAQGNPIGRLTNTHTQPHGVADAVRARGQLGSRSRANILTQSFVPAPSRSGSFSESPSLSAPRKSRYVTGFASCVETAARRSHRLATHTHITLPFDCIDTLPNPLHHKNERTRDEASSAAMRHAPAHAMRRKGGGLGGCGHADATTFCRILSRSEKDLTVK